MSQTTISTDKKVNKLNKYLMPAIAGVLVLCMLAVGYQYYVNKDKKAEVEDPTVTSGAVMTGTVATTGSTTTTTTTTTKVVNETKKIVLSNEQLQTTLATVEDKMKSFEKKEDLDKYVSSMMVSINQNLENKAYESDTETKIKLLVERLKRTYKALVNNMKATAQNEGALSGTTAAATTTVATPSENKDAKPSSAVPVTPTTAKKTAPQEVPAVNNEAQKKEEIKKKAINENKKETKSTAVAQPADANVLNTVAKELNDVIAK